MNFTDRQLQKCYEGNLAGVHGFPDELRPIYALITAHDLFRLVEGPHSARAHEAIQQLLLPNLRPVLRWWYQRSDADTNPEAIEFREHLSGLAGEKLEV
jgi:glucose-6-phosphate dehydrogenase assembly protein OpcA